MRTEADRKRFHCIELKPTTSPDVTPESLRARIAELDHILATTRDAGGHAAVRSLRASLSDKLAHLVG